MKKEEYVGGGGWRKRDLIRIRGIKINHIICTNTWESQAASRLAQVKQLNQLTPSDSDN